MKLKSAWKSLIGSIAAMMLSAAASATPSGITVDLIIEATVGNPITATDFPINTSVVVTTGVEFSQFVSMTFISSGFSQTLEGTLTVDIGETSIFSSFVGIAQGVTVNITVDNLTWGSTPGEIVGAAVTSSAGFISGVNFLPTPTFESDSVSFGFGMLGTQPGTNLSQTVGLTVNHDATPVPEPSVLGLMLIGLAALGFNRRRS